MEFIISSDSLSKLAAVMGGGSSGGSGNQKGMGKMQSAMQKFNTASLGKMAMIGGGVMIGVSLVQKIFKMIVASSPMLQSMLKLFQVGIMFILRPIGDFVGFLLRPLMVYLLRSVILPWYRSMAPLMKAWGSGLGEDLVNFIKDPLGTLTEIYNTWDWGKAAKSVFTAFKDWTVIGQILNAIGLFNIDLGSIASGISEKYTQFMDGMATSLQTKWNTAMESLGTIATGFSTGLSTIVDGLTSAWDAFSLFFTGGIGLIGTLLGGSWEAFSTFIFTTLGKISETLKPHFDNFTSFFASIGNIWGLLGKAWEDFLDFMSNLNPMNWGDGIMDAVGGFVDSITNNNSKTENNVKMEITGGGNNIDWWENVRGMIVDVLENENGRQQ